jgi:catechol 2,3-dioxygenase-like lactoylglutathione lyase family enzyme
MVVGFAAPALPPRVQRNTALGLDHIPVAVRDLEKAAATFRRLGFALKPGRPHANGIRNVYVKFPDGSGIELLTAPTAVDELSAHYVNLLESGEGPAFISFHERNTAELHASLRNGGYPFRENAGITALRSSKLSAIFLVRDNRSPTDRPEHFAHANGATAMRAVWLAPKDGDAVIRFLTHLGGRPQRRQVLAPGPVEATIVRLASGEVVVLPEEGHLLAGRPVIGASFTVPDLARIRQLLREASITPRSEEGAAARILIEPADAHGLWLEFVQLTR